jgi:flagellar hook-basal body complex protein FliE
MPVELFGTAGTGAARATVKRVASAAAGDSAGGFADSLGKLLDGVEKAGGDANKAVSNMLDKSGEVHDAMIALQRAEMTLQLTVQIRNKLVQAYQDIMRMPI